jgi:SAM-dependent methyltransferase
VNDDPLLQRGFLRTAIVHEVLRDTVTRLTRSSGREQLDVLDAGGGTGNFAVPVARLGHRVTVVDPNPDALAALARRAAEAEVTDLVRGVQGDSRELLDIAGAAGADVVLCHGVLEHVEDAAEAVGTIAAVLRPAGALSLLAANRNGAVLARALAGHFAEARHTLGDPDGRWGDGDPLPRRFSPAELTALVEAAGLRTESVHGVRVFSDVVPNGTDQPEPAARAALHALEAAASREPAFHAVAAQLHVLAVKE